MFICVSPNPAIDKRLVIDSLTPGAVIRATSARGYPGGKSAHVAMVLRTLGETPHWIGPCGGPTGDELVAGLDTLGIQPHPVRTKAETRTNLEIVESNGTVTEILEPGGTLSAEEIAAFETSCRDLFALGGRRALIILSGSLPPGMPVDFYRRLVSVAREYHCRTLVDAGGEPLRLALAAHPDFVKPNRNEAGAVLGRTITSASDATTAVRELTKLGAEAAALSLGAEGMVFCPDRAAPIRFASPPKVSVRSTVGCGDSAMAGFAYALGAGQAPEEALRLATACAAANCLADSPGAARMPEIRLLEGRIAAQTLSIKR
jgi:1-phosphofructokinase family hexose kinase